MSTAVATKKALVSILDGHASLSGVQVTYADDVLRPKSERIYLGDVEEAVAEPATMRATRVRLEEDYTIRVLVSVDSKTAERAETRAVEILNVLTAAVADDPKLLTAATPPAIVAAYVSGFEMSTSLVSEGEARTLIEADLAVKARNS